MLVEILAEIGLTGAVAGTIELGLIGIAFFVAGKYFFGNKNL